jgi:hypothetical protein
MKRSHRTWIGALAIATLAACGGGGGSSGGPPPSSASFDVNAGWRNVLTITRTWTVSGVASDGKTYTLAIGTAPGPGSTFPVTGAAAARADVSVLLSEGGTTVNSGVNQTFFDPVTYLVVGTRNSINTPGGAVISCSVATSASVPPASATIGASGALDTLDELDGCLPTSAKVGTSTSTWSLETEAGINYLCLNSTVRDLNNALFATESDCLEIATNGTLGAHARITVAQGSFTLTARN